MNHYNNLLCYSSSVLVTLELLADAVGDDLVPVNLCSSHRKLSSQSLECGLRHGLIVLADTGLTKKTILTYQKC